MKIPNEISAAFGTAAGRRQLMKLYGNSENLLGGNNQDGEAVLLSIHPDCLIEVVFQSNGWTRIDTFDAQGNKESERYDGRWK